MPRPNYTPAYSLRDGVQLDYDGIQTAYTAGLSYFPDYSYGAEPLGDIATDAGALIGGAVGGPAGAAGGGAVGGLIQRWVGGSAVDQQRQARVNYFAQLAGNGNVAAMQLILGAPNNVSGNEQTMWVNAAAAVRSVAPDVYAAAQAAGPAWLTGSGDTATNYPAMKNFVQTWAAQHPVSTAVSGVGQSIAQFFAPTPTTPTTPGVAVVRPAGVSPILLYGALAAGAFLLMKRRRSA
jgi:hypothetical protein